MSYRVTVAPRERGAGWTLSVEVDAKSKNDARTVAMRKVRTYLADRDIRILGVKTV